MLFIRSILIALQSMWSAKLRTFLTLLGTIIGVFSVVAVVSVIQGLNRYVANEILGTGSHVFNITKYGIITDMEDYLKAQRRKDFTLEDAEWLRRKLKLADVVVAQMSRRQDVRGLKERADMVAIVGIQDGYPEVGQYPLGEGRHLTEADVSLRQNVAVVGSRIREELMHVGDPIGQKLRIGGHTFHVVGVLEPRGSVLGISQDDIVIVPITSYQKIFGRRQSVEIQVKALRPELMLEAQDEAMLWAKIHRGLKPYDDPDFAIVTSDMLFSFYEQATAGLFIGMLGVVGLSLLVGGIVIMNIMLVAVAERTKEIGLRRALGARAQDIVLQFLVESATISGLGGVAGVILGAGLAWGLRAGTPLPTHVDPFSILGGLLLAIVVGVVFGLYPARRASRLHPIQALRQET
ncbi:MAG: ABC transporter permease [Candidatus Eisenbacteria bacterium]|uniref:ABC transporter permease n=1 Tax=Eiseniibacteriota bacterium TaxID=2212470 RepID=A0A948W5F0_UNCEI|nr:ABC transporter permease [Candidatus Eisenbacteria bacterium]MBU1947853.1 ABC transporter permease [Candidatus Eisenbacteria bacterium]MBU2690339.1 ABC transporter permease [Candidatus Eisenbacteria bacterium]